MKRKPRIKSVRVETDTRMVPDFAQTQDRDAFDKWVVENALYFNVSMKTAPGKYSRNEFKTLKQATALALTDRRYMVYAVTHHGRTAMLTRPDYDKWLKVRGEIA